MELTPEQRKEIADKINEFIVRPYCVVNADHYGENMIWGEDAELWIANTTCLIQVKISDNALITMLKDITQCFSNRSEETKKLLDSITGGADEDHRQPDHD